MSQMYIYVVLHTPEVQYPGHRFFPLKLFTVPLVEHFPSGAPVVGAKKKLEDGAYHILSVWPTIELFCRDYAMYIIFHFSIAQRGEALRWMIKNVISI